MRAHDEDLASEFEYESDVDRKRKKRPDVTSEVFLDERHKKQRTAPSRDEFEEEKRKEEGQKARLMCLDAYSRHKQIINDYFLYYPGATKMLHRDTTKDKTDIDVIRANHKFLWDASDEPSTWEKKLAKRYYDKLFKEYCICDLSRYRENKVAMRWRTQQELVDGTGQFTCGAKKCDAKDGLSSWEVNFSYMEEGHKKNALVKLRLCPQCSYQLNYHHKRKPAVKKPKMERKKIKKHPQTTEEQSSDKNEEPFTTADQITEKQKTETTAESAKSFDPDVWKKPIELEEEKSRDEEFEDFLDDLLL